MVTSGGHGLSRAKEVFLSALDQPESSRSAHVRDACGGDGELEAAVLRLLQHHAAAGAQRFLGVDDDSAPDLAGGQVGPYRLQRLLGEGGFGRVYLATQSEPLVRDVAVKVLKPGMDNRQVIARFAAERQALALMDHPHIARIFDAGATPSGEPYFVMEYVVGEPVTAYCDARTLRIRERLEVFETFCQAVHHAHQKGVIHRDIKPSNLLVGERDAQPDPKVIDFGIAKAVEGPLTADPSRTGARQVLGTPRYMSPEQARAGGGPVDTRTDIYSLGVVLYELLTGTTPNVGDVVAADHEAELPSQRIRATWIDHDKLAFDRRADPIELVRGLRGDLDGIALKALALDPDERYDSAAALGRDVRRHLEHEPVLARRPGAGYLLWKLVRRHQVVATAIVAIAVALVAGFVMAMIGLGEAHRQREIANDRLRAVQVSRARALRASGQPGRRFANLRAIRAAAAIAPGDDLRQEIVATMGLTDLELVRRDASLQQGIGGGPRRHDLLAVWHASEKTIEVGDAGTGERVARLTVDAESAAAFVFSEDGSHLAVALDHARVEVHDLVRSERVLSVPCRGPHGPGIAFERGVAPPRWIAVTGEDARVRVCDLDSGMERLGLGARGGKAAVAVAPDGSLVAVGDDGPTPTVRTYDLASGGELSRWPSPTGVNALEFAPHRDVIAGACDDGRVFLWSAADGTLLNELAGHQGQAVKLAFSTTGELLASYAWDYTVRLWDVATGERWLDPLREHELVGLGKHLLLRHHGALEAHHVEAASELRRGTSVSLFGSPCVLSYGPTGELVTAGQNGVEVRDPVSLAVVATLTRMEARGVVAMPDALLAAVGGRLLRWPWPSDPAATATVLRDGGAHFASAGPDGRSVLLVRANRIELVDCVDGAVRWSLPGFEGLARAAVSGDGRHVFAGTWQGERARVLSVDTGATLLEFEGRHVRGAFHPDSSQLCVGDGRGHRLIEVGTWRTLHDLPRDYDDDLAGPVAFSPDGSLVAFAASRSMAALARTEDGVVVARLSDPGRASVHSLAFDASGDTLAVLSPSTHVLRWDLAKIRTQLAALSLDWRR